MAAWNKCSNMSLKVVPVVQNLFKLNTRAITYFAPATEKDRIVLSSNGTTFVAWHPEKEFPYECTQPIPANIEEDNPSLLKTAMSPELKQIFKKKTPEVVRQELMDLTYTTEHRWFPRSRDKKAKKTKPDREYL